MRRINIAATVLITSMPLAASSQIRITEWAYQAVPGEYVELTNLGGAAVNMSGWSYDDDSRAPGSFSLSGLGMIAPGESVIFTETADPAAFRTAWGLSPSVKVLGAVSNNLGRNDEINIFDGANQLVDRLTFGDQNIAGSIRTQERSGNPMALADLGGNNVLRWRLSLVGDVYGSYTAIGGAVGNPGLFLLIPEPSSVSLLCMGAAVFGWIRRGKKTSAV